MPTTHPQTLTVLCRSLTHSCPDSSRDEFCDGGAKECRYLSLDLFYRPREQSFEVDRMPAFYLGNSQANSIVARPVRQLPAAVLQPPCCRIKRRTTSRRAHRDSLGAKRYLASKAERPAPSTLVCSQAVKPMNLHYEICWRWPARLAGQSVRCHLDGGFSLPLCFHSRSFNCGNNSSALSRMTCWPMRSASASRSSPRSTFSASASARQRRVNSVAP